MKSLAIDQQTGEFIREDGRMRYTKTELEFFAQAVHHELSLFLGEWYLAPDKGLPYIPPAGVSKSQHRVLLETALRVKLTKIKGVKRVVSFVPSYDKQERLFQVSFVVQTDYGTLEDAWKSISGGSEMTEYGITEKGFVAKPYSVILEEERESWKAAFGYDIDPSADTPEGAYIGNQAIKRAQLEEKIEALWAAGDADSASGIYLDRLAGMVNVQRKAAESTKVYEALWGDEGTEVLAGHLAKLSTGEKFALQESVTINREKLLGFQFKVSEVSPGETYQFQVDAVIASYVADEEDDEMAIQAGLFASLESYFSQTVYTAENTGDGMIIHRTDGIAPFVLICDDPKIEIVSLGTLGIYKAVIPGPVFTAIGTLNRIVSVVSGLDHIINYATGITGRAVESDAELRIEKNNRQKLASGNEVAIQNEIKKLAGIQYCRVYSNRGMTEMNGRPPKSFEAIVVGGLDQEIAETIFTKGPAGIQAFGNTIIEILDTEGFPWSIGFSRPENRYIWIKIEFSKNTEEAFPVNGIALIKDNIDDWGAKNQGVGEVFIYQKLNRPIYDVPGIGYADIKAAVTDDLTPPADQDYASENVEISERQIALIDKSRISVEELLE